MGHVGDHDCYLGNIGEARAGPAEHGRRFANARRDWVSKSGPAVLPCSSMPACPETKIRFPPWTVRIFFTSGVEPCYVLDRVGVAYRPTEVRITLFEGSDPRAAGQPCIQLAVGKVVSVALDQPLAGRTVVYGA